MARRLCPARGWSRGDRRGRAPLALLLRRSRGQRRKGAGVPHSGSTPRRRRPGSTSPGPAPMRWSASVHALALRPDADAGVERFCYRSTRRRSRPTRSRCCWMSCLKALTISISTRKIASATGNRRRASRSWWIASRRRSRLSIHGPQFSDKGVRYVSPQAEIELASRDAVAGPTPIRYRHRRCAGGHCLHCAIPPACESRDSFPAHRVR